MLLLYAYDLMARVLSDLSDYKIISPFSYANAADILSTGEISTSATLLGIVILAASLLTASMVYTRRDLAS